MRRRIRFNSRALKPWVRASPGGSSQNLQVNVLPLHMDMRWAFQKKLAALGHFYTSDDKYRTPETPVPQTARQDTRLGWWGGPLDRAGRLVPLPEAEAGAS